MFRTLSVIVASLACFVGNACAADPSPRPNVLFIIADDLRPALGEYGDKQVQSPYLDMLAAKGMRFDRAYCQYPVCNPSRTSVLTGLRPDSTGVLGNNVQFRTKLPNVVTLPQLLKEQGYFTASLGKVYHRGLSPDEVKPDMDDAKSWTVAKYFTTTERGKKGEGRNLTDGKLPWCRWLAAEGDDEDQPDGQIAAEAVKLLETKRDRPFFLAVGFHRPHDPFLAPKKYYDPYPLDRLKLNRDPENRGVDLPLAVAGRAGFDRFTDKERLEFLRAYYAGVSFMDAQAGKLFLAMDRAKLWDNTLVVFWGDHGYHLGERGWWNKNTLFELSAGAPLLVWAPGKKGMGKPCKQLVEFVDMYPTIAELCGVKPPANLEGVSFVPLLDDPAKKWKTAAFTQVQRGQVAGRTIRTDRYRYTEWDDGKQGVELYDHIRDPGEYTNVAQEKRYAEVVEDLKKRLRAGWKQAMPPGDAPALSPLSPVCGGEGLGVRGALTTADPPEIKPLRRLAGTWESSDYNKKALWNPIDENTTAKSRYDLILNGSALQITGKVEQTKVEFLQIVAYDRTKKVYRHYYLNSLGQLSETSGQWDETKERFTFMAEAGEGVNILSTLQLKGPDAFEWKVLARDREGKVYLDMGGTAKRTGR